MSQQLIATKRNTITAVSGDIWETIRVAQTILYLIIVQADTSTTVFDVILENSFGDEVFKMEDITGTLTEEVRIPFSRNGTIKIESSTVDEDFIYTLTLKEN